MKSVKSIVLMLIFIFASNIIYGQSIKYVPADSELVANINYERLIEKAGKDTINNIINEINISKLNEMLSGITNIEQTGINTKDIIRIVLTPSTNSYLYKSRTDIAFIISLNDKNKLENFIETDLEKSTNLKFERFKNKNYTLIKFFKKVYDMPEEYTEEDETIYTDEDEVTIENYNESESAEDSPYQSDPFIAYNDEVIVIASSEKIIENIFSNSQKLTSETFISLSKENNDVDIWVKTSFIYSNLMSSMIFGFYGGENAFSSIYENATLTAKLNFYNGSVMLDIDQYTPDYKIDSKKITVKIDKNLYKYFNEKNNIMFVSLALNLEEYYNAIMKSGDEASKSMIDAITSSILSEYNITMEDVFEVIRGDAFLTVDIPSTSKGIDDMSFVLSLGIKDQKKLKSFLDMMAKNKMLAKRKIGKTEVYESEYNSFFSLLIKDGNLYVCSSNILGSLIKGKPSKKQPLYMTKLADENMVSIYFDIEKVVKMFIEAGPSVQKFDVFKNAEMKSNYIDDNHSKTTVEVIMKDKSKNSLNILLNLISEL